MAGLEWLTGLLHSLSQEQRESFRKLDRPEWIAVDPRNAEQVRIAFAVAKYTNGLRSPLLKEPPERLRFKIIIYAKLYIREGEKTLHEITFERVPSKEARQPAQLHEAAGAAMAAAPLPLKVEDQAAPLPAASGPVTLIDLLGTRKLRLPATETRGCYTLGSLCQSLSASVGTELRVGEELQGKKLLVATPEPEVYTSDLATLMSQATAMVWLRSGKGYLLRTPDKDASWLRELTEAMGLAALHTRAIGEFCAPWPRALQGVPVAELVAGKRRWVDLSPEQQDLVRAAAAVGKVAPGDDLLGTLFSTPKRLEASVVEYGFVSVLAISDVDGRYDIGIVVNPFRVEAGVK